MYYCIFFLVRDDPVESNSSADDDEPTSFQSRGRPDGGEGDEVSNSPPAAAPTFSTFTGHKLSAAGTAATKGKVSKPPIAIKPDSGGGKRNNSVGGDVAAMAATAAPARLADRRESSSSAASEQRRESVQSGGGGGDGPLNRQNSR